MADAPLQLIIGNYNTSSWSLRASLVLRLARLAFTEVRIPLRGAETPGRIARYSPSGKVPVLIADGVPVWDTLAIAEFVAELEPAIWPVDPKRRAEARSISAEMHSGFADLRRLMPMDVVSRYSSPGRLPKGLAADINRIKDIWRSCRHRFGADGPFLFGAFSVADAMMAPVTTRFVTHGVPIEGAVEDYVDSVMSWPDMVAWCNAAAAEQDERRQPGGLTMRETEQSGRSLGSVIESRTNGNAPPPTPLPFAEDKPIEAPTLAAGPAAEPESPAIAASGTSSAVDPSEQTPSAVTPLPETAKEVAAPALASTGVAAASTGRPPEPSEIAAPSAQAQSDLPPTQSTETSPDGPPGSTLEPAHPSSIFIERAVNQAKKERAIRWGGETAPSADDTPSDHAIPSKAFDMPPLQSGVEQPEARRKLGWIRQPVPSAHLKEEGTPGDPDRPARPPEDAKPAEAEQGSKPAKPATSAVKPIGGGILRRR